ncbi:MAG: rhomboid family intramembrane serine protease [Pirellulaceae bacterium]
MGIYDRDYYRGEEPRGIEFGGRRAMVTNIVIVTAVLYVVDIFLGNDHGLMKTLAASPDSLTKPWLWWQLLTYGFAHSYADPWHIIWNMFALWMLGREVEGVYGRKEILRIYLVTVVIGGLVWTSRICLTVDENDWGQHLVLGASGAVSALVILFCLHFPRRQILLMFVFPMPAWILGAFIVVVNLLGAFKPEQKIAVDVHLAGIAFALAYYRFGWNLGRWIPGISLPTDWFKRRPKLKLHDPETRYTNLDTEADAVLDKVNRNGIESLNAKERRVLEEYSRRMRQKHR